MADGSAPSAVTASPSGAFLVFSSIPSRSHSGSVVDASDEADAVDWSCCRCVAVDQAINVDVEVADHGDVAVVDVVVADGVVVVEDEAAQSRRRKKNALWRSCRRGQCTLRMSEGAVGDESADFVKTGGSHRAHIGFARTMWPCRDDAVVPSWMTRSILSS